MLSDKVDRNTKEEILDSFENKSFDKITVVGSNPKDSGLYKRELIKSYAAHLYNRQRINKEELDTVYKLLSESSDKTQYNIDLSEYKSPLNTFDDRQLSFGYKREKGRNYLKLNFLPASNTLSDDNREYFNEYTLKLGEISLLVHDKGVDIESFQLYAMKTLIPWNDIHKRYFG